MKQLKRLGSFATLALFALLLAPLVGVSAPIAGAIVLGSGLAQGIVSAQHGHVAFDGLGEEIWLPLVKEGFYPDNSFLNGAMDMSSMVNYDKINFAEAGADPNVLVNNTTYPVAVVDASDTPLEVVLKTYDTETTVVRNAVAIELSYDQAQLYASKHKKALLARFGRDAAFAYAPAAADANNKIINLGPTDSIIDGIIDLQKFCNEIDEDGSDRNLVLCPTHMAAIAKEDKVLYKAMMVEPGSIFYSFKIWTFSKNPIYANAGTKAAFGTAYNSSTHKLASFSFLGNEVMKAIGTIQLFSKLKDPDLKGDGFNFQMRALASSLRGKYSGAILRN